MTITKRLFHGKASLASGLTVFVLGCVAALGFVLYQQGPFYWLHVYRTDAGWGYDIRSLGRTLIHQPTLPGRAGQGGFKTAEQARRVGEAVEHKLRSGLFPPMLTQPELDSLLRDPSTP